MKDCDLGLENAALGLRPREAFSRRRSQFFTIRTSQLANNIVCTYIIYSQQHASANSWKEIGTSFGRFLIYTSQRVRGKTYDHAGHVFECQNKLHQRFKNPFPPPHPPPPPKALLVFWPSFSHKYVSLSIRTNRARWEETVVRLAENMC